MCFYFPKLTGVFFGNRQESNARAGQKKTHVFLVMRGLNLMRAYLKQRKKHSGLMFMCRTYPVSSSIRNEASTQWFLELGHRLRRYPTLKQ